MKYNPQQHAKIVKQKVNKVTKVLREMIKIIIFTNKSIALQCK